jgi:hypothetical protein
MVGLQAVQSEPRSGYTALGINAPPECLNVLICFFRVNIFLKLDYDSGGLP